MTHIFSWPNCCAALVTGAGRGIGRAIAIAFAAEGAAVALSARSTNELQEVVAVIKAAGGRAIAVDVDLTDRAACRALLPRVKAALGGTVDILVNNAGVGSSADPNPVVDFNDASWDLQFDVNVHAPYLLCKAALPDMVVQK